MTSVVVVVVVAEGTGGGGTRWFQCTGMLAGCAFPKDSCWSHSACTVDGDGDAIQLSIRRFETQPGHESRCQRASRLLIYSHVCSLGGACGRLRHSFGTQPECQNGQRPVVYTHTHIHTGSYNPCHPCEVLGCWVGTDQLQLCLYTMAPENPGTSENCSSVLDLPEEPKIHVAFGRPAVIKESCGCWEG